MTAGEWVMHDTTRGRKKVFQILADIARPFERLEAQLSRMIDQLMQKSDNDNRK